VLAAVSGFLVVEGWRNPGVSATHWLTSVQTGWLVAGAAGIVLLGLLGFQVWFSLQLLSQNGRTLARLEALEAAIASLALPPGVDREPAPLGAGLSGSGLRVGSPAPVFALRSLEGEELSLRSLLADGKPVMLVFTSVGCGPCDALLPDVAGWQRDHAGRLTVVVIAGGEEARNREKAERHGLEPVLVQSEREVSDAYRAYGTPTAVVVGVDGLIASPVVGGSEAIGKLVVQAARAVATRDVPSKGRRNGRAAGRPPDRSHVGEPAPELVLTNLDGEQARLSDLYGERTVAIFWNPGCGFCRRMLPDLKSLEANQPDLAPRLVVISGGEADAVREHGFRSPVLLDPESLAMHVFNAHGTPTGVLIEHGMIASPLVTGADALLRLVQLAPQTAMNGNVSSLNAVGG
jgi:thiol-disulfide isomerase/thioredoxin